MRSVAIVGVSGYSGLELLRLLAADPAFDLVAAYSDRAAGAPLADLLPAGDPNRARWPTTRLVRPQADAHDAASAAELVALATPAEVSAELAPGLVAKGARVLDLSGAFRLRDTAEFQTFYRFEHPAPQLLPGVPYGLPQVPAAAGGSVREAKLVANPGCYATAAILALAPLLAADLIEPTGIFVDGKSGVSGAGRKVAESTMFMEVSENVTPYRVADHQHTPEIELALTRVAGKPVRVTFAPHLLPLARGLVTTCFAKLARPATEAEVRAAFDRAYASAPGLAGARVVEVTSMSGATVHAVARTPAARVAVAVDVARGAVVSVAALDNLLKGAASQALENLHAMAG